MAPSSGESSIPKDENEGKALCSFVNILENHTKARKEYYKDEGIADEDIKDEYIDYWKFINLMSNDYEARFHEQQAVINAQARRIQILTERGDMMREAKLSWIWVSDSIFFGVVASMLWLVAMSG